MLKLHHNIIIEGEWEKWREEKKKKIDKITHELNVSSAVPGDGKRLMAHGARAMLSEEVIKTSLSLAANVMWCEVNSETMMKIAGILSLSTPSICSCFSSARELFAIITIK